MASFKAILDHVEAQWFAFDALRYLFAGVCALCVGLAVRLFGEFLTGRDTASDSPKSPEQEPRSTVHSLLTETSRRISLDFREATTDKLTMCGWSQYLDDAVPPSAIGTAYGLRLAISLDIRDSRINRRRIVETLLALQKPGGGWAASTQRGIGRPEVTAWVLAAAVRGGLDHSAQSDLVKHLERMIESDGPLGMGRTIVVTTLVSTLSEVAPGSPLLLPLVRRLLDGSRLANEIAPSASWGESLHSQAKQSVPHSARAVVALSRAASVLPSQPDIAATVNAGITWLSQDQIDLRSTDEQLRRPVAGGDVDALFIGHFTSAWVARALMCTDRRSLPEKQLQAAVRVVLDSYQNGAWTWHDGSKPIWMVYQAVMALREYALRNLNWPP